MLHEGGRPRALDLFCGAGGATKGLQMAGFHVTGIDIKPQPRYCGDAFLQGDAMRVPVQWMKQFDFVWASPPCQGYSITRHILRGKGITNRRASNLIPVVRHTLLKTGTPFVIENVPGSRLLDPVILCGSMFNLRVYRHRLFESCKLILQQPDHPAHNGSTGSNRGYSYGYPYVTVGGHNYKPCDGKQAMEIDWMTRDELNEAIPPAFGQWIGEQVMKNLSA